MNTVDEMIEVLQAYRDGKPLEVLCSTQGGCEWISRVKEFADRAPDFHNSTYRVKKLPQRLYVTYYGEEGCGYVSVYDTKEEAEFVLSEGGKVVAVEVVDEKD